MIVEPNGAADIIDTSTLTFEEGIAELTGDNGILDVAPTMANLDGQSAVAKQLSVRLVRQAVARARVMQREEQQQREADTER
eukprot:COSAG05_NODE_1525_length_4637_cov_17.254958_1_plen_82_part_00